MACLSFPRQHVSFACVHYSSPQHGSSVLTCLLQNLDLKNPFPESYLLPFQLTHPDASHCNNSLLRGPLLFFSVHLSSNTCTIPDPSCLHLPLLLNLDSILCRCKHPQLPSFSLHHTLLVKIKQIKTKQRKTTTTKTTLLKPNPPPSLCMNPCFRVAG